MLHLIIPGLLDKPGKNSPEHLTQTRLPHLETLLSRGNKKSAPNDYVTTLFKLFDLPYESNKDLPTAAICYHTESNQSAKDTYLLHADPIHLKPDQDRLLAFDFHQQPLTMAEAEQFAAAFNQHFAEDGLKLHTPDANRWYVSVEKVPDIQTKPLIDVIGRNIDLFLPQGADAQQWLSWMNEIQMLFHSVPVNIQRESYGQIAVNGLWFSGGGTLPTQTGNGFAQIEGNCILLDGLQQLAEKTNDAQLIVEHKLGRAAINNDWDAWSDALQQLEEKLAPFMQNELMLYPCNGDMWHWQPKMQWQWWRKKRAVYA